MSSMAENPILTDEEQNKENSPPANPVTEGPAQTPVLMRNRPFWTRIESVPDSVYTNLFE